ncbi:MAG: phosphatidate cytidylyltransferase [Alphaproteobacteria bacterium]|nr:phosphatidate cytidylyltransferase [Alphaproteobacteria bacterium]
MTRWRSITIASGATVPPVPERRREVVRRVASGLVLAPIAVASAWLGGWWFAVLTGAVALLAAGEWERLLGRRAGIATIGLGAVILGGLFLAQIGLPLTALAAVLAAAGGAAGFALLNRRVSPWHAAGIVHLAVPVVALIWLRSEPSSGRASVLWLLLVVWATDIGAFACGRIIGGAKLAPRLSPGKTWAGAVGGLSAAALVGLVAASLDTVGLGPALGPVALIVLLSLVVSLAAQGGDLIESALKRRFLVKDSGRLIPGHGGVLDRVDSLLLASPAAAGIALAKGGALLWR